MGIIKSHNSVIGAIVQGKVVPNAEGYRLGGVNPIIGFDFIPVTIFLGVFGAIIVPIGHPTRGVTLHKSHPLQSDSYHQLTTIFSEKNSEKSLFDDNCGSDRFKLTCSD